MDSITVKTWLPCFPGFYESPLYHSDMDAAAADLLIEAADDLTWQFPGELLRSFFNQQVTGSRWGLQVDFEEFKKDTAFEFCEQVELLGFDTKVSDWPVTRINFLNIDSPRWYNWETDAVVCEITFFPELLEQYCRVSMESFQAYLAENYTSRSGFCSFYDPDPEYFLNRDDWERDPHIVGSLLNFVILDQLGPEAEQILSERVRNYVALPGYFSFPAEFDDWLDTDGAASIAEEYRRVKQQCASYVEIMGPKYKKVVDDHWATVIANLTEDMEESLTKFENGDY